MIRGAKQKKLKSIFSVNSAPCGNKSNSQKSKTAVIAFISSILNFAFKAKEHVETPFNPRRSNGAPVYNQ
jgi:hypothetical protein